MLKYLLITHIPFVRGLQEGEVVIDGLWARDLAGLAASMGTTIRVAAPELTAVSGLQTWGPSTATIGPESNIEFVGLPYIDNKFQIFKWLEIRSVLKREVAKADLVQTSNFFPPYMGLSFAHDCAVKLGKKTLFVVAEDFLDMLSWEWVRTADGRLQFWRRRLELRLLEQRVRASASSASLTFLHTPAAVIRYRDCAKQGFAIRQPGHEVEDVTGTTEFDAKLRHIEAGHDLLIVAACRHKPLKGLDFLIRACALLAERQVPFTLRLYGDGDATDDLRKLADRYGISKSVEFPGVLPPGAEIYKAIAAGHIFAMPHRTTDFGRAFFDAMAGGTPVVAFRTPASQDTIRDGVDGMVCPLDDTESLASTIERLHENRCQLAFLARCARQRALKETRSAWYRIRAKRISELI